MVERFLNIYGGWRIIGVTNNQSCTVFAYIEDFICFSVCSYSYVIPQNIFLLDKFIHLHNCVNLAATASDCIIAFGDFSFVFSKKCRWCRLLFLFIYQNIFSYSKSITVSLQKYRNRFNTQLFLTFTRFNGRL